MSIPSPFAHLESINEDKETLSSLGGKENPEEAELGRYIKVLQARKKKLHWDRRKWTPKAVLPEMDQPKEYQAPPFKPLLNTSHTTHSCPCHSCQIRGTN